MIAGRRVPWTRQVRPALVGSGGVKVLGPIGVAASETRTLASGSSVITYLEPVAGDWSGWDAGAYDGFVYFADQDVHGSQSATGVAEDGGVISYNTGFTFYVVFKDALDVVVGQSIATWSGGYYAVGQAVSLAMGFYPIGVSAPFVKVELQAAWNAWNPGTNASGTRSASAAATLWIVAVPK